MKRSALPRSRKPMSRGKGLSKSKTGIKRKPTEYDRIRPTIKEWFMRAGFTHCELGYQPDCNVMLGDGFAHARERDQLTPNGLWIVAYACNNCHNKIEGKPWMEQVILDVRKRNTIPEIDAYIKKDYG